MVGMNLIRRLMDYLGVSSKSRRMVYIEEKY